MAPIPACRYATAFIVLNAVHEMFNTKCSITHTGKVILVNLTIISDSLSV